MIKHLIDVSKNELRDLESILVSELESKKTKREVFNFLFDFYVFYSIGLIVSGVGSVYITVKYFYKKSKQHT